MYVMKTFALLLHSAAYLFFGFTGSSIYAAVVITEDYRYFDPGDEGRPVGAQIDINQDGETDFRFTGGYGRYLTISTSTSSSGFLVEAGSGWWASFLEGGDSIAEISMGREWSRASPVPPASTLASLMNCPAPVLCDRELLPHFFLGVVLSQPDGDHYGWIEMRSEVPYSSFYVEILRYGYETEPGVPITIPVPEPSAVGLAILGLGINRRRRSAASIQTTA
jgi:hypothetical protein